MTLLKPISHNSLNRAAGKTQDNQHSASESTLAEFYWSWFDARVASTEELRDTAFRLRYRVYCIENSFEDPAANPDGREIDEFDQHSVHGLLTYRPTQTAAGTVRLVLPI